MGYALGVWKGKKLHVTILRILTVEYVRSVLHFAKYMVTIAECTAIIPNASYVSTLN
jgi:hypothetical protein